MPAQPPTVSTRIGDVDVEIRRSSRRRRTMSARFENGGIVVLAPAHLSAVAERDGVTDLVTKMVRKRGSARNDDALMARARELSRRYIPTAPEATSVRWVSTMRTRWASCSPADGTIRISDGMVGMPQYVIDAVLVHELAHLVERGHGPAFQRIVRGYEKHDVAEAYLAGASFGARQAKSALPELGLGDEDEPSHVAEG